MSTLRRILHKYGLTSHPRRKKPFVSLSNRRYRKRWAKVLKEWTFQKWKDVIFSDESKFSLNNDSGTMRVWRKTSEANNPSYFWPTFTNSVSAMICGCIGSNGVGRFVLCTRTVNALIIVKFFKITWSKARNRCWDAPKLLSFFSRTIHHATWPWYARIFLSLRGIKLLPWPSPSPDINIIENVWLFLKWKVQSNPSKNKEELITRVFKDWHAIPKQFIDKLYQSIPRRIEAELRQRSYPTKYWSFKQIELGMK